jgi:hypothetical protein
MKTISIATVLVCLLAGCATTFSPHDYAGTTSINLTGQSGAAFTGYYIQDGKRIPIEGTVPWNFSAERISKLEIRKINRDDSINAEFRYVGDGAKAQMAISPGSQGIHLKIHNGIEMTLY